MSVQIGEPVLGLVLVLKKQLPRPEKIKEEPVQIYLKRLSSRFDLDLGACFDVIGEEDEGRKLSLKSSLC